MYFMRKTLAFREFMALEVLQFEAVLLLVALRISQHFKGVRRYT